LDTVRPVSARISRRALRRSSGGESARSSRTGFITAAAAPSRSARACALSRARMRERAGGCPEFVSLGGPISGHPLAVAHERGVTPDTDPESASMQGAPSSGTIWHIPRAPFAAERRPGRPGPAAFCWPLFHRWRSRSAARGPVRPPARQPASALRAAAGRGPHAGRRCGALALARSTSVELWVYTTNNSTLVARRAAVPRPAARTDLHAARGLAAFGPARRRSHTRRGCAACVTGCAPCVTGCAACVTGVCATRNRCAARVTESDTPATHSSRLLTQTRVRVSSGAPIVARGRSGAGFGRWQGRWQRWACRDAGPRACVVGARRERGVAPARRGFVNRQQPAPSRPLDRGARRA
jgi:hypothetical protein